MSALISLKWLLDRAARELEHRAPQASMTYFFDDGAEKVDPDKWARPAARQNVQARLIHSIEHDEITLLGAFGTKVVTKPPPLAAINSCAVSREDAMKILEACGIGPEALDEVPRRTPEDIRAEGRAAGKSVGEIARAIKAEHPKITAAALGELLPANPGSHIEHASHARQGRRVLKLP